MAKGGAVVSGSKAGRGHREQDKPVCSGSWGRLGTEYRGKMMQESLYIASGSCGERILFITRKKMSPTSIGGEFLIY